MTDSNDTPAAEVTPATEFIITTLEQLKVFADPLRQQIVESIMDSSKTVKQVAGELGLAPTKLYYHFNLLDEHGFITVTDTRVVSGIIEKQYRSSAQQFAIKRTLLNPGATPDGIGLDTALDALIGPIRSEIHRAIETGVIDTGEDAPTARKIRIWRELNRMTEAEVLTFYERLEALLAEFHQKKDNDHRGEPTLTYQLMIAIYPSQRGPESE